MRKKRVAIVGMSYRLPGSNRDSFWPDLLAGRNFVTQIGPDRWSPDTFQHPKRSHPGTSYTFAAGNLGDISGFDAGFFGISPREAAQMDPQQRLLLELTWESFENAGIRPSAVRGSPCGVYIGVSSLDYSLRFTEDLAAIDSSVATGNTASIAANRISYVYDLRGPSISVDTACSSSLVAFHLACRSIISGESSQAIAGGVSLHLHPYGFIVFSKASMLSKRGICNVFDAAGDGYVRSEGGALFLLKDYDQALADGDRVLAVVANSAVNSDGRKSGLTVPSVQAQAALLKSAYDEAGIPASEIDYIEAHGTGTAVGDPIETHALGDALGRARGAGAPLLIGSVKSNLGHLETAAGAAGLVKALFCLQHRTVPATIHIENPNPNIRFDEWNLKVATEPTALKPSGKLVVGVNSFGFGGANAHVILSSPESRPRGSSKQPVAGPLPVVLSAKSAAALKAAARDLALFLEDRNRKGSLYDVACTAVFHREWHEQRAVFMAGSVKSLVASLKQYAEEGAAPAVESGTVLPSATGVAFVYSGNGSQWEGMGRRLIAGEPAFRDAVRAIDATFRPLAGFSLEDELAGANGAGRYEYTEIAQPALFAIQVGVTEVLRARGLVPAAVAGHSVGEVAAAWASGALSLEQAVRVIYHRSRLQSTTKGRGQMSAVGLGEKATRDLLDQLGLVRSIEIAGINSSGSVTVAGETSALDTLEAGMNQRRVSYKRLDLDYAFHSPAMDGIEAGIREALAGLRPAETGVAFHSAVTGEREEGARLGAEYWWRNIREPVRFEKAAKSMIAAGAGILVEVGPHALLRGYINTCLREENAPGRMVPTLLRDDDSPARLWSAVGQAAIAGAALDWRALFPRRGRFVQLPNYPWQREHLWHSATPGSTPRLHRRKEHPLLGYRLQEGEWTWENQVDTALYPVLADHVIGDATVMPGSGFAEMAMAAARLWLSEELVEIEQLEIRAPLVLNDTQSKVLRFSIDTPDGGFTVRSRDQMSGEAWTIHATGRILREPRGLVLQQAPLTLPTRPADFTGADHDQLTASIGLGYGPAFRAIDAVWMEGGAACARFRIPEAIEAELEHTHLHPAILDCTFQLIIQLLKDEYVAQAGAIYVPAKIDALLVRCGSARPHMARATLSRFGPHSVVAGFTVFDAAGVPIASIREARFRSIRVRKNPSDRLRYLDYHGIPKPHPLSPVTAPRRLFQQLQRKFADLAHAAAGLDTNKRYTSEIEPLLDGLCGRFALRALKALSSDGHALTEADVHACVEANPAAAPLLARLIGMLEEDHAVEVAGDGWRFLPDEGLPTPEEIWNSLVTDHPDYFSIFHSVGRVGMHLADLLMGRKTPEQVYPRECTLSTLARRVLVAAGLPGMQQALHGVVAQAQAQLPAGKRLRILEIGADAPTFAAQVCRDVDFNRCDYVYATLAPSMPEECHRLRERFPGLEIRQLSTDANPEMAAPPADEQFQLAVVTGDFATEAAALSALSHMRRYLAPRAAVLVVEQHPSRWMDFIFGGQRAWWSDGTKGESWTSRHKAAPFWRHHLQQLGLNVGTTLELSADASTGPYLLVAQAVEQPGAVQAPPPAARTWLMLADKEGFSARFAAQLARTLAARGDRVIHVTPGSQLVAAGPDQYQLNPQNAEHYAALLPQLAAAYGQVDGILHLYGLGASFSDAAQLLPLERQVDRCAAAAAIVRACENAGTRTTCWLVTARAATGWVRDRDRQVKEVNLSDNMDAALWGFGRTLMNEVSGLTVRLADIQDPTALDNGTYTLARELAHSDAEQEVVLTGSGDRYVPRLRIEPSPAAQASPTVDTEPPTLRLGFQFPGQLRNLRWEAHPHAVLDDDDLEIEVRATGLNFRDVMYSLGLLSDEAVETGFAGPTLGLEFSGVVLRTGRGVRGFNKGDRVVGFGPSSFSNRVTAKAASVSLIPDKISFEAAATIPSVFFTVFYSLHHLARLQEGEKILIHGAAGGVGIAAIQIARWCGAEIFATAGSDEKRDFLRLLGADHVFDSRSLAFADEILAVTKGRGVDVVLNSLAGEAINRNLRVLRPFGRFLELGKRDFYENTRIGLRPFRNNISYFGIDADQLMQERPEFTEKLFREMMALFRSGVLHPLPYHRFEAEEIVEAFRFMQQSRHIGKIVITYENGIHPVHTARQARRTLELPADATYLVTGGLGGFGLKTAQWLAAKGARNLVLVSRSGPAADEAKSAVAALEGAGVKVHAAACDITDRKALAALLTEVAATLPPLRGIVHAATVIDDGLVRNLTREQIRRVFAPKILGAHYLHQLTLGKELDFFVLYSSATTLFGNPGQGNYVAANSQLEAFAAARRAAGLPALCVRWGAIEDAGFLSRNPQIREALQGRMGGSALASAVALDTLEELLYADRSGVGVLELDWKTLSRFLPTAASPKFSELAINAEDGKAEEGGGLDVRRLLADLPPAELMATFIEMLKKEVGEILRIAPDKIDEARSLYDMGLDSLMGVELATAVEARFSVRLPVMAMSENPTIARLAEKIIAQLTGVAGAEEDAAPATGVADQTRQILIQHAQQADDEAVKRFAEELNQPPEADKAARMIQ